MGLSFSCPFSDYNDVETGLESIIVRSISLGDDQVKTAQRSVSFNGRDSDPKIHKSLGSGEMVVEGSVSFKQREKETMVSINSPSMSVKEDIMSRSDSNKDLEKISPPPVDDLGNPKHKAAVKLQKVYKSFRTRRKLADCAVLVEQSWWKLLDFAELKHSSISFFDIENHETAFSRWSRAKTRAAKVGKGLLKNDKAQKLALQHWLEAIDPRHRYGHNLHFYYDNWLRSHSREPFFYWIDIGEGKEVNLEKCPRSKLQQQCIKYLGPTERLTYEVGVENGRLFYKESGELLDTSTDPEAKWIFVLSTSKTLYVGKKSKGTFQHSSFLAGGATSAAGRLVVENGELKAVWPHSGHYKPTQQNFQDFISFLKEHSVDLSDVKMDPVDDEQSIDKQMSSHHLRNNSSEEDMTQNVEAIAKAKQPIQLGSLLIPKREDLIMKMELENLSAGLNLQAQELNVCDDEDHENKDEVVPEESILKRINSHKETKSCQLGKQLSCKWTSGAGPRIGCVRDYPSELQFRALEQVNLSPRSRKQLKCTFSPRLGSKLSPKLAVPDTICSESSILPYRTRSSPLSEMTESSS